MARYMTKQRRALLELLLRHTDEALSARQIASMLEGGSVSVSAVYRNLAALEEDGMVKRVSRAGSNEAMYQYIDAPECRDCLHLSCKKCGRTFHMKNCGAEQLIRSVARNESFAVDKADTVIYGLCSDCQRKL